MQKANKIDEHRQSDRKASTLKRKEYRNRRHPKKRPNIMEMCDEIFEGRLQVLGSPQRSWTEVFKEPGGNERSQEQDRESEQPQ